MLKQVLAGIIWHCLMLAPANSAARFLDMVREQIKRRAGGTVF
jgi:hypothetical protein